MCRRGAVGHQGFGSGAFSAGAKAPSLSRRLRGEVHDAWRLIADKPSDRVAGIQLRAGEGQPVLVLPGFTESDRETRYLVRWLAQHDYQAVGSRLGRNSDCFERSIQILGERLRELYEQSGGRKVIIVGHSRGGVHARVLAIRHPELIEGIITLGIPSITNYLSVTPPIALLGAAVSAAGTIAGRESRMWNVSCFFGSCCRQYRQDTQSAVPPEVKVLQVQSAWDGAVNWWRAARRDEPLKMIRASHLGMIVSSNAFAAVAEGLELMLGSRRSAALDSESAAG